MEGARHVTKPRDVIRESWEQVLATPSLKESIYHINRLIEQGSDVNASWPNADTHETPLLYAIRTKKYDIVQYLLDRGANPLQGVEDAPIPLEVAVISSDLKMLDLLLQDIELKYSPKTVSDMRALALTLAMDLEDSAVVGYLSQEQPTGRALMPLAVIPEAWEQALGAPSIEEACARINTLIENGEDVDVSWCNADPDDPHETPLLYAMRTKKYDIVRLLLEYGADPQQRVEDTAMMPIEAAVFSGDRKMLDVLLEHIAQQDPPKTVQKLYEDLLILAIDNGHLQIVQYLVSEKNININKGLKPFFDTPLGYALGTSNTEIADFLIQAGANPDVREARSQTAFAVALDNGDTDMVKRFLEGGADPDRFEKHGETRLQYAVAYCSQEMVECLLASGVDPDVLGEDNETPLRLAVTRGDIQKVQCLLAYGADANARGPYHSTPLLGAVMQNNIDIARLLIRYGATDQESSKRYKRQQYAEPNSHEMLTLLRRPREFQPVPEDSALLYLIDSGKVGEFHTMDKDVLAPRLRGVRQAALEAAFRRGYTALRIVAKTMGALFRDAFLMVRAAQGCLPASKQRQQQADHYKIFMPAIQSLRHHVTLQEWKTLLGDSPLYARIAAAYQKPLRTVSTEIDALSSSFGRVRVQRP